MSVYRRLAGSGLAVAMGFGCGGGTVRTEYVAGPSRAPKIGAVSKFVGPEDHVTLDAGDLSVDFSPRFFPSGSWQGPTLATSVTTSRDIGEIAAAVHYPDQAHDFDGAKADSLVRHNFLLSLSSWDLNAAMARRPVDVLVVGVRYAYVLRLEFAATLDALGSDTGPIELGTPVDAIPGTETYSLQVRGALKTVSVELPSAVPVNLEASAVDPNLHEHSLSFTELYPGLSDEFPVKVHATTSTGKKLDVEARIRLRVKRARICPGTACE